MTIEKFRTASDDAKLFYRYNVFDYLPERCVTDALAFLKRHFPEEQS